MNAVFGCGFIGRLILDAESSNGYSVLAFVRSNSSLEVLERRGLECLQLDLDKSPKPLTSTEFNTLYYLIPPPATGTVDTRSRNALRLLENTPVNHVVLISTTGVYGNCNGDWIDETRPLNPGADRSFRRVDSEYSWREWTEGRNIPLTILRVSGIYASDRLPEKRIRAQTPVLAEAESPFSNRIHADDLVTVCVAAARLQFEGVLNVADDEPTTMTNYFFRVADALGLPRPPEISMEEASQQFSDGMMSYLRESRRIDNTRLKRKLGIELRYPTLVEGLRNV